MRRISIIFLLFSFIIISSYSAPFTYDPYELPNTIDSLPKLKRNSTFININYYPKEDNKYLIELEMFQIVSEKSVFDSVTEALSPEFFFNRDYVPDDLKINIYETEWIDDVVGSCLTNKSKCEVTLDLTSKDFDEKKSCFEVYAKFQGNDDLAPFESEKVLLCKSKHEYVEKAFGDVMDEIDSNAEYQSVCIFFFIFIGFLVSSLFVTGGNPLKYFDITSPRLPKAKAKIKLDLNLKENVVRKGRTQVRALKRNLERMSNAILEKDVKPKVEKYYTNHFNIIGKKENWSEEKIHAETKYSIRNHMEKIKKEFKLLLKEIDNEIEKKLNDLSSSKDLKANDYIDLEKELQDESVSKITDFFKSKMELKDLLKTSGSEINVLSDTEKERLEKYSEAHKSYYGAKSSVDYISRLQRRDTSFKKITNFRRFVESVPIIGDLAMDFEGFMRKGGSAETAFALAAVKGSIKSVQHHHSKSYGKDLIGNVEKIDELKSKTSSENILKNAQNNAEIKKLDLLKEQLKHLSVDLTSKEYENQSIEIIKDTLSSVDRDELQFNINADKAQIHEVLLYLDGLTDLSSVNKNYVKSMLKVFDKDNKIKFKQFDEKFIDKTKEMLKSLEIGEKDRLDILKKHQNTISNSYKNLVENVAFEENLENDINSLGKFKSSSALLKPDNLLNNVTAKIFSERLLSEVQNIPSQYLHKLTKENLEEEIKKSKENIKKLKNESELKVANKKLKEEEEKLKEFSIKYGQLVSELNPQERFEPLLFLTKNYDIDIIKIEKAKQLQNQIRTLKIEESPDGIISGANELISFFDEFKRSEDLLELGIIDNIQDARKSAESYLEVYSGFDSKVTYKGKERRIKDLLKTEGFDTVVDIIDAMTFSEKEIRQLHGTDTPHTQRMEERTKKLKETYLVYGIFINHFNDSIDLFKERYGRDTFIISEEDLDKLRDFFADNLSEYYEGNYSSNIFTGDISELSEKELIFRDKANEIFENVATSLKLSDNKKNFLIENFRTHLDLSQSNMKYLTKQIDKEVKNNKNLAVTEKWVKDSSLHRAEAIRMPVLQQNIFKLRDFVEHTNSSYNKLHNISTVLNNEKKESILKMNLFLGNYVKDTDNLTGQQILSEMLSTFVPVLGEGYDKYFRKTFEKPRIELLENELGIKDISPHVIYDIMENKFDKVRDNLKLSKRTFSNKKMKEIQSSLLNLGNNNMYNRIYHRGWESFENQLISKSKTHNINIDNIYDLYDLLDGKYGKISGKFNISNMELSNIRENLLGERKDTYDLMRSKGVEFLTGGVNSKNNQEVYYMQKGFEKFRLNQNEGLLLECIEEALKSNKIQNVSSSKVKNIFNDSAKEGLLIPGMEITVEAEMKFAWNVDVRSIYIPLYQLGDRERAFTTLIQSFKNVYSTPEVNVLNTDEVKVLFKNIKRREEYLNNLKKELSKYEGLDKDKIMKELNITPLAAENIKNYKDLFYMYESTTDYQPSFKTTHITGKVTNVMEPRLMKQEDGSIREVLLATDTNLRLRKFGFTLENLINKHIVTFPMIGMMAEAVSVFNTEYRSKDYFSKSIENYGSFDTTDVGEMLRNKQISNLTTQLYMDKWAFSNMVEKGVDFDFEGESLSKKINTTLDSFLISKREELKYCFDLGDNFRELDDIDFDNLIKIRQDALENAIEEADTDKAFLLSHELKELRKKYDEFRDVSNDISELKNNLNYYIENIEEGITNHSSTELNRNYDKILEHLTPYAGEYSVKFDLELTLMKKEYHRDYAKERIEDYEYELKVIKNYEKTSLKELEKFFKKNNIDIRNLDNSDESIELLNNFISDMNISKKDRDFVGKHLSMLIYSRNSDGKYDDEIKKLKKTENYYNYLKKNKGDWNEIVNRHSNKAKLLGKKDVMFDRLYKNSSVLFENFVNTYERLYKTRTISAHTRKAMYGFTGNEYGGTQFAGPIASTPLQYSGTLAQTGNVGWFSVSVLPFIFKKMNREYAKNYPFRHTLSDVSGITVPMGVSTHMSLTNYFKMEIQMRKNRFGEYLNPLPEGKAPPPFSLMASLFSKNIRGERRITEMLDFLGGDYRGTPGGFRDVYNYISFRPNELTMDFKDKIYTYKDARSMKKAAEFLYDVGIYAPFTNNRFIAGREISLFNDIYYGEGYANSTFYPNRAMNLLSSAPHYGNPKYRNMAYGNFYKLTQTQSDMVREVMFYDNIKKTPDWNPLSIAFIPLMVGTSGFSLALSSVGFAVVSGAGKGVASLAIKAPSILKKKDWSDVLEDKYLFYYRRGLYSSIYPSGDDANNNRK